MRRGLILIFALIFISSASAAEIEVGKGLKTEYNLGDVISFNGKVTTDIAKTDKFTLNVVCLDKPTLITKSKLLILEAGESYSFTEQMVLSPLDIEGNCYVGASFGNDKVKSKSFSVVKNLKGGFDINDNSLQLGEGFVLNGEISKLNDVAVDGQAIISLMKGEEVFDTGGVDVKAGRFNYSYITQNIPPGKYDINIFVLDGFGNEKTFAKVASFESFNELKITANLDKNEIMPGESIGVNGDIKYKNGDLADAEVRLTINGNKVEIKDGLFGFSIDTLKTIKSGESVITLKANDEFGNMGEGLMTFKVNPVPTRLTISKNKEEYNPGDDVGINTYLYDQADDLMDNDAKIIVKDADGYEVEDGVASLIFKLDKYAIPGVWEIKAEDDITMADSFLVKELKSVNVQLNGQDVIITNTGNVNFDDGAVVKLDDDLMFSPEFNLGINESYTVVLDVYYGNRKVDVFAAGKEYNLGKVNIEDRRGFFGKISDQITGNVVDEGSKKTINPWAYVVVVGVLLAILIGFYFYKKKTENYYDGMRKKERKEAVALANKIRQSREKESPRKRIFYSRPINQEDAKDFKEQMLGRIKEQDKDEGRFGSRANREDRFRSRYRETRDREMNRGKDSGSSGKEEENKFKMFD